MPFLFLLKSNWKYPLVLWETNGFPKARQRQARSRGVARNVLPPNHSLEQFLGFRANKLDEFPRLPNSQFRNLTEPEGSGSFVNN